MISAVVVLVCVATSLVAFQLLAPDDERSATTGGASSNRTVTLLPDSAAEIAISDRWTLLVPRGGVSTESTLTIDPVDDVIDTGVDTLDAARLTLSTGQPANMWSARYRLDDPLPADAFVGLLNDPEDVGPSVFRRGTDTAQHVSSTTATPASLNDDRTVATVEVTHLSLAAWIQGRAQDLQDGIDTAAEFGREVGRTLTGAAGDANHAVGRFFGSRGEPPNCGAQSVEGVDVPPPDWVTDVIGVDDQNAPILFCATRGTGPTADYLMVRIVNNRGTDMVVISPAQPAGVSGTPGESFSEPGKAWPVPGTEEITLYFRPDDLRVGAPPLHIDATFSPQEALRATVAAITGADIAGDIPVSAQIAWNAAAEEICVAQSEAVSQLEPATYAETAGFSGCVLEKAPEIASLATDRVPAQSSVIGRVATVAKRANLALAVGSGFFAAADNIATLNLIDAASRVSVFWSPIPEADLTAATEIVTLRPVTAAGEPAAGWSVTPGGSTPVACGYPSPAATGNGIHYCSPTSSSADVCWPRPGGATVLCLIEPWQQTLYENPAQDAAVAVTAVAEPIPLALELADGTRCRLRNGGSWSARTDDDSLAGFYYCDGDASVVWGTQGGSPFDAATDTWTVRVGTSTGPLRTVPVETAYFAGQSQ